MVVAYHAQQTPDVGSGQDEKILLPHESGTQIGTPPSSGPKSDYKALRAVHIEDVLVSGP